MSDCPSCPLSPYSSADEKFGWNNQGNFTHPHTHETSASSCGRRSVISLSRLIDDRGHRSLLWPACLLEDAPLPVCSSSSSSAFEGGPSDYLADVSPLHPLLHLDHIHLVRFLQTSDPLRCSLQYVLLAWTLGSLDVRGGASTVAGGGWLSGSHWEASCGTSVRLIWVGKRTTGEQEHSLLLQLSPRWCHHLQFSASLDQSLCHRGRFWSCFSFLERQEITMEMAVTHVFTELSVAFQ